MEDKFSVVINYKNKNMEDIGQHVFTLDEYTKMISNGLKYVITDVENSFYDMQNEESKDNWSQTVKMNFNKIRHKLLDYSNYIERLPQSIKYGASCGNTVSASGFVADIINERLENK